MQLFKNLLKTTDVYIRKLAKAGVFSVEDFLNCFPKDLQDRTQVLEYFSYVNVKDFNSVIANIEAITDETTRNKKLLVKIILKDKAGFLCETVYFNNRFILNQFKKWDKVIIYGKPKYEYGKLSFISPDMNFATDEKVGFFPTYSDLNYISWDWIAKKMDFLKSYIYEITDIIPEEIRKTKWFAHKSENISKIHFPKTKEDFYQARKELAYEELFDFQYRWILRKIDYQEQTEWKAISIPMNAELIKEILSYLPFEITSHQKITIFQILKDMEKKHSMTRLLQWDVWTGKTAVALITAIHAIKEAWIQVAIMAPTEILARQHFEWMQELLEKFGIKSELLIWSLTPKQKKEAKDRIKKWQVDIIIWTHALVQEWVFFHKLGYVVIDEQHRFWVEQRKVLENHVWEDGEKTFFPHNLNMTATPIPRTLSLTIYWDQDLSIISEYPAWRKTIWTKVVKDHNRTEIYRFVQEEIKNGRQVYWISPLVEDSEKLEVASATQMYKNLSIDFPKLKIGLLHWKMKPKEKDFIMKDFIDWKIDILSSTSVVEVWVNNPNATIICIEASERFWLSQLHQFRWRVGRWEWQSYCYLFTTKDYVGERLRAMEKTNNWFELSEMDLELRWPWEVYWVRQSWVPDFKIASLKDLELISEIREDIEKYLENNFN